VASYQLRLSLLLQRATLFLFSASFCVQGQSATPASSTAASNPAAPHKALSELGTSHPGETPEARAARMAWWHQAKFGMFIHWGLYAIPADGEWHMRNHHETVAEYSKLAAQFNPTSFKADEWMTIAQDAGMKYMVITAKHHDGFAMFSSKASNYNVVDATPFKRDPLKELSEASRLHGIKFGVYYSAIADWYHPGGRTGNVPEHWDPAAQDGNTDTYINTVAVPQVKELLSNYGPLGELWFDTDGAPDMTDAQQQRFYDLLRLQPQLIVDPRLGRGDFATEEQRVTPIRPLGDWEACLTITGGWGYSARPAKSAETLIRKIVDVVSMGGNVLLNVGPDAHGIIPPDNVAVLHSIGDWLRVNGESFYGSDAGPIDYLPWGRNTRKGNVVYLHVYHWPEDGVLRVPLPNSVDKAYLLVDRTRKLQWQTKKGELFLQLAGSAPDPIDSVVAIHVIGAIHSVHSLALNAQVTASSNPTDAANITDDDPTTKWKPEPTDTEPSFEVHLQKPAAIGAVRIGHSSGKIGRFFMEYRQGTQWKPVFDDTVLTENEYVKTFAPVTSARFRFTMVDVGKTPAPDVNTFELFPPL
jgi:alpha-L-fucosidase